MSLFYVYTIPEILLGFSLLFFLVWVIVSGIVSLDPKNDRDSAELV